LCISCHSAPIPGVPQIGDKEAWAPRIAQGMETLYEHSIEGFHGGGGMMMPPRGGDPSLSDEEVKAAVDYIVEQSQ
jgi:cytochrome c5